MKKPNITVQKSNIDKLKKRLSEKEAALKITERHLEIGAALDRVRSLTMVMKRPEDLSEIILTVYKELRQLDIALTRTLIWLFSENPDMFEVWVADIEADDKTFVMKQEVEHPYHKRMFEAWKKRKSKWVYINEGEGKKDLDDYLFTRTAAAAVPEEVKTGIRAVDKIVNSFSFHNFGCIQADGAKELSDDNFEILYRFAKEFDLAYTRYIDLKKAEDQAREAQIETALEKVRTVTMGMQKSDELQDAALLLFQQVETLGVPVFGCGFNIWDDDRREATAWMGGKDRLQPPFKTSSSKDIFLRIHKAAESGETLFVEEQAGTELKMHYEHMASIPVFREIMNKMAKTGQSFPKFQIMHCAFFSHGYLMFISYEPVSYAYDIFKRFAKVFEQTYTRFLDLKKAEAQAREAQIEAALERVRARTMAMHQSDELREVVFEFFEQLHPLGFAKWGFQLRIAREDEDGFNIWISTPAERILPEQYHIPTLDHWVLKKYWDTYKRQIDQVTIEVKGDDKLKLDLLLFEKSDVKKFSEEVKKSILDYDYVQFSVASMRYGLLEAIDIEPIPQEYFEVLKRFAKVFEQTYTRFLDLQKAEVQAREAEIQLAIERVRARTMAMHKSEELGEVSRTLYTELQSLGFENFVNCGFINIDEAASIQQGWGTLPGDKPQQFFLPLGNEPVTKQRYQAWKRGDPVLYQKVGGARLKKHIEFVMPHLGSVEVEEMVRTQFTDPTYFYSGNFSHGYLFVVSTQAFDNEQLSLVQKFTSAFELAYQRFLDLKKAETQAREAEIQLALERVRARTMAMQHSDELSETSFLLAQQVRELGIKAWGCAFHVYAEDKDGDYEWFSNEEGYLPFYKTPREKIFKQYYEKRENGETLYMKEFKGKVCAKHYEYLMTLPIVGEALKELRDKGISFPTSQIDHVAYFKFGYLLFITYEHVPQAYEIFKRFAKEFEQTYTRFLDLKKAEAQAREAEIEVALERVRSRGMAMHKSDELAEVAIILYEELVKLGIRDFLNCGFVEVDEKHKAQHGWSTLPDGSLAEGYYLPITGDVVLRKRYEAWKQKVPAFHQSVGGKDLKKHMDFVLETIGSEEVKEMTQQSFPDPTIFYCFNFSHGYLHIITDKLLEEENQLILIRFSKAFEQTYTRFLDLKKAEAQAREAQIEAALERIRAQSMAMHKSHELSQVASLLYQQFLGLGISQFVTCGFNIYDENQGNQKAWITQSDGSLLEGFDLPLDADSVFKERHLAWKRKEPMFVQQITGKVMKHHVGLAIDKSDSKLANEMAANFPDPLIFYNANFSQGYLSVISGEFLSPESQSILIRFAKVFEQTYTRFLDLKKAEAQAREAQIETALERVRSRTMGMHISDEMLEVGELVYKELSELGITAMTSGVTILGKDGKMDWYYVVNPDDGSIMKEPMGIPRDETKVMRSLTQGWEKQEPHHIIELNEKETITHQTYIAENSINFPFTAEELIAVTPKQLNLQSFNFKQGFLILVGGEKLSGEKINTTIRFAKAFEQTYTRFLDLQKAEEQAREAEIQLALERVRARTMAMHRGDELADTAKLLFEQITEMGIKPRCCGFLIMNDETKTMEDWSANLDENGKASIVIGTIAYDQHPIISGVVATWKRGDPYFIGEIHGEDLQEYYKMITLQESTSDAIKDKVLANATSEYTNSFNFNYGMMYVLTPEPIAEVEIKILLRFADVFKLTYRRFLDLKKAEAQAREAQIEAALEKIRGRSMAMHNTNELTKLISTIFSELTNLDVVLLRAVIVIYAQETYDQEWWMANSEDPDKPMNFFIKHFDLPPNKAFINAWKEKRQKWVYLMEGDIKKEWDELMLTETELSSLPEPVKTGMRDPAPTYCHTSFNKFGCLTFVAPERISDDQFDLIIRFAKVFDQAYTRYNDLQKAEDQAREAQIEASLERVRAKAMAMQKSDDLSESVAITLIELENLELTFQRCGIGIIDGKTKKAQLYTTTRVDDGKKMIVEGDLHLTDHPMLSGAFEAWDKQEKYSYVLKGKDLRDYYELIFNSNFPLPEDTMKAALTMKRQYAYYLMFPAGALYFFSTKELSDSDIQILQRFSDVFHLAYTRFEDLQNAEARAIEAERQASLDRVRGVIASMRSKEDLNRITPLIWEELKALNVPFIRCGVFIMDEANEIIRSYLSAPDGKTLGIFDLPFRSELIGELMVNYWQQGKIYKDHWSKVQFVEFMKRLNKTGQITDPGSYQGATAPPEQLYLHFIPFRQGMLYVGNLESLTKDELLLVKSLAEAFSIAYSRYEDFKELELAKNKIEATLNELKSAQSQLIHAEKMASLGELTAGIAHEIQNPLNFVNNFSEVTIDLIEELKEERNKEGGERDELIEKELLDDVIQNLEKINHHGLRASSIVKGMLEHSRTGSKEKQLININALADEYLRLAYHGLRAKDKSFNADFSLEKDDSLPEVKIIPQDIGRVLLNLINNAFYTVSDKAKHEGEDFKPQVIVSTQAINTAAKNSAVEIRVKDNGNGISNEVIDKIFQPFFTTKPTGKGTGLGLSLSYDIIKAHGGEIKVESNEGEGTEFTINLPRGY